MKYSPSQMVFIVRRRLGSRATTPTTGAKIVATRVAALYAVFQQLSAGVFTSLSYPSATFGKFLEKLFFFT